MHRIIILVCLFVVTEKRSAHADSVTAKRKIDSYVAGPLIDIETDYPRFTVAIDPILLSLGVVSVSSSYSLSRHVAVRGDFTYLKAQREEGLMFATLGAPLYWKQVYSGMFIEPHIKFGSFFQNDFTGLGVNAGWTWLQDEVVVITIAVGGAKGLSNPAQVVPTGYLRAGVAF